MLWVFWRYFLQELTLLWLALFERWQRSAILPPKASALPTTLASTLFSGTMKFFVDTADVSEIRKLNELRSWMVSRPTTLIAKSDAPLVKFAQNGDR